MDGAPRRLELLGLPIDAATLEDAAGRVLELLARPGFDLVVTLNPEILWRARTDRELAGAVRSAALVTADGRGVLWAATRLTGERLPGRVSGIELAGAVLSRMPEAQAAFFLGGRPGVAQVAARRAAADHGCRVAGHLDGYRDDEETVRAVAGSGASLLLAGLGERQEVFLSRYGSELGVRVGIGVGGSLDVWSGQVKRAPGAVRALSLEWAWRIGTDRRRWDRLPRLWNFTWWVLAGGPPVP
jgi:N-acetylglucosaminyldiphosphoundecaprenol N-acetyl-beta-D-mannosaminyltransferase